MDYQMLILNKIVDVHQNYILFCEFQQSLLAIDLALILIMNSVTLTYAGSILVWVPESIGTLITRQ